MLNTIICLIVLLPLHSFVAFELKEGKDDVMVYVYDGSENGDSNESRSEDSDLLLDDAIKDK